MLGGKDQIGQQGSSFIVPQPCRSRRTLLHAGLLIAADFIRDLYVHMGFHPAWKYEVVLELIFEHGRLTREFERSDEMAEIRSRFLTSRGRYDAETMPSREEIEKFVERAFDRRYRL